MAKELAFGIVIGAALSSAFTAAFGNAKKTIDTLGASVRDLTDKQKTLGATIQKSGRLAQESLAPLHRDYERLGRLIDEIRRRQEALTASLARGAALKQERADLRGQALETVGTGAALGAPVVASVRLAGNFQDQLRDIAITGEFTTAQENRLGAAVRESALKWNQTQAEIASGIGVLVAGGVQDAQALDRYTPVLAKAATATRASMADLGSVLLAFDNNLKVSADQSESALNMLAYAGKRGQFEIRDSAKWLPALAPMFQTLGVTGKEAVAEIGAALQIARKGAGTNDEAANNFRNFLAKLTSPDTLKDFDKAGIDLQSSLKNAAKRGISPMEAMMDTITAYIGSKGPQAAAAFKQALSLEDAQKRAEALQALSGSFRLGELFQDMQAMSFIRPMLANRAEYKDIKQGALGAANQDLIGADFQKRTQGFNESLKAFRIGMSEVGLVVGEALLPPLTDLLQTVRPVIREFGQFASAHPGVIRGVVGLTAGLLGGKLAVLAVRYAVNLLVSPFNALATATQLVLGKWTLLKTALQFGPLARAGGALSAAGSAALGAGRALGGILLSGFRLAGAATLGFGRSIASPLLSGLRLAGAAAAGFGRILIGSFLAGLRLAGVAALELGRFSAGALLSGLRLASTAAAGLGRILIGSALAGLRLAWLAALELGRILGGALISGLKLAAQAVMFLGRALLFTPIGAAVAIIAGAAFLIWKNWDALKARFAPLWDQVKGIFGRALSWFKTLPDVFKAIGSNLLEGLRSGIMAKWESVKAGLSSIASGIKDTFKSALGIHSPSRVFAGYGADIGQGLIEGVTGQKDAVAETLGKLVRFPQPPVIRVHTELGSSTGPERSGLAPVSLDAGLGRELGRVLPFAKPDSKGNGADSKGNGVESPAATTDTPARLLGRKFGDAALRVRQGSDVASGADGHARTFRSVHQPQGRSGEQVVIHFNPTIHVSGAEDAGKAKAAVTEALELSLRDFERVAAQASHARARTGYR
ncbi:prophage MuMc02, tail tape measure protein, TP901 family [Methylococcus capsulatus str. Bath]|uniref:Prophage MuMc02, tail tape measure protein, TP901 family n=4 Tax=Methylococcus TaxID=413 RepID=Q602Z3_METCA|nr:phage tail tape measure protein [Methylococcus capsulatus]AAU91005.1 prophage MuMc02, tail tape measure protein, TP901 family [Methylococcus capsulatus str. Bath]